jgi:hypothetical protein
MAGKKSFKFKVKGTIVSGGKKIEGTSDKPGILELNDNLFFLTTSRYINGEFITATPDSPVEIRLDDGEWVDSGMRVGNPPPPPKKHYAATVGAPTAAEVFGNRENISRNDSAEVKAEKDAEHDAERQQGAIASAVGGHPRRDSDKSPV